MSIVSTSKLDVLNCKIINNRLRQLNGQILKNLLTNYLRLVKTQPSLIGTFKKLFLKGRCVFIERVSKQSLHSLNIQALGVMARQYGMLVRPWLLPLLTGILQFGTRNQSLLSARSMPNNENFMPLIAFRSVCYSLEGLMGQLKCGIWEIPKNIFTIQK